MRNDTSLKMTGPLKVAIHDSDLQHAVCGSATRCTIANAVRRLYPLSTYVKVGLLGVTVTHNGYIHHFNLTQKALNLIAKNDEGTLEFTGEDHQLEFARKGKPAKASTSHRTDKRREQVNAARKARADAGKPDSTDYKPNSLNAREEAAKRNNKHRRSLATGKRLTRFTDPAAFASAAA